MNHTDRMKVISSVSGTAYQIASHFALLNAGVTESLPGDYPVYWNCMAEACGIDFDGDPDSPDTVRESPAVREYLEGLKPLLRD